MTALIGDTNMKSNKKAIVGWVLSGLLSAFLILASATPKFIEWEGKTKMMEKLGWTTETIFKIGFVEAGLAKIGRAHV